MSALRFMTLVLGILWLWGCGTDYAGKTTTTTNGLAVLNRQGQPVANARIILVHQWSDHDSYLADTVHTDSLGILAFPPQFIQSLAFVLVDDPERGLGSLIRNSVLQQIPEQQMTQIWLDTLLPMEIRLSGHSDIPFYLDSSLYSGVLDSQGFALLPAIPMGYHDLWIIEDQNEFIKGRLAVHEDSIIWNSWNLGDLAVEAQTPVQEILWIENFEDGDVWPIPATNEDQGRWRLFIRAGQWVEPDSAQHFENALIWNRQRNSRQLSLRYIADSNISWAVAQISPVYWDISSADSLCFWYRTDGRVKIEWLRQYISEPDWGAYQWIPANSSGADICLDLNRNTYNSAVPDSLKSWDKYSTWVVQFQFLLNHQGSYLELDDIRLIR